MCRRLATPSDCPCGPVTKGYRRPPALRCLCSHFNGVKPVSTFRAAPPVAGVEPPLHGRGQPSPYIAPWIEFRQHETCAKLSSRSAVSIAGLLGDSLLLLFIALPSGLHH